MNRQGRLKTYLPPHQQALYWKQWVTTRYTPIFWRNKPIRQRQTCTHSFWNTNLTVSSPPYRAAVISVSKHKLSIFKEPA